MARWPRALTCRPRGLKPSGSVGPRLPPLRRGPNLGMARFAPFPLARHRLATRPISWISRKGGSQQKPSPSLRRPHGGARSVKQEGAESLGLGRKEAVAVIYWCLPTGVAALRCRGVSSSAWRCSHLAAAEHRRRDIQFADVPPAPVGWSYREAGSCGQRSRRHYLAQSWTPPCQAGKGPRRAV